MLLKLRILQHLQRKSPLLLLLIQGREEQAEPEGMDEVTACASLIGVDPEFFVDTFMKPKLKVGKDYVKKGQNVDQVAFSVSATSKSLFARLFDWIVAKVNDSLDAPNPRKYFIGKQNEENLTLVKKCINATTDDYIKGTFQIHVFICLIYLFFACYLH